MDTAYDQQSISDNGGARMRYVADTSNSSMSVYLTEFDSAKSGFQSWDLEKVATFYKTKSPQTICQKVNLFFMNNPKKKARLHAAKETLIDRNYGLSLR